MRTSETNIGYLFTKDYFRLRRKQNADKHIEVKNGDEYLKIPEISDRSTALINVEFDLIVGIIDEIFNDTNFHTFELKTIYPGLLIGSGYIHDLKSDLAFKLGFYFDHTTGLPVIPGSSIKGVLRNAFKMDDGKYVQELLKEMDVTVDENGIRALEKNIFDSAGEGSVYRRDKFFDAFPVATSHREGLFLADDYITPHPNPLKDPLPIRFLKVRSGVTYRFVFELFDFDGPEGARITAEQKLALFRRILLDLGVGAKTNVGYGQFQSVENDHPSRQARPINQGISREDLQSGDIVEAKVVDLQGGVKIDLGIKGINFQPRLIGLSPKNFTVGQIIKVRVNVNQKAMYEFTYIEEQ